MPKKINEVLQEIPKSEKVTMTFIGESGQRLTVTQGKEGFYLYQNTDKGYKFLKSRSKDPCFPECY